MDTLNKEKYISLDEAADYFGIKPVTLRSWIRNPKNEVPAHKIDNNNFFDNKREEVVNERKFIMQKKITCVDLFCGCGGMSLGFINAGFDIIAGHRNLSNALAEFSDTTDVFLLKELISCLEDYDYILIDSAPARSPLLNMGYVAADYCLILTEADKASQDGVKQVVTDIKLLKKSKMSDISILGIVLNKNEDLKNQEEAYKDLCAFGKTNHCMPFTTIISKAAGATTAKNMYKSIHAYRDTKGVDKRSIQGILNDFENLADEIEQRIVKIER